MVHASPCESDQVFERREGKGNIGSAIKTICSGVGECGISPDYQVAGADKKCLDLASTLPSVEKGGI